MDKTSVYIKNDLLPLMKNKARSTNQFLLTQWALVIFASSVRIEMWYQRRFQSESFVADMTLETCGYRICVNIKR